LSAPAAATKGVPPLTAVQACPLAAALRLAVSSTLPLFVLPGGGSMNIPRPLLSVVTGAVTAVLHHERLAVKLLICTLLLASVVQLSSLLVINPSTVLVGGLV